MTDRQVDALRLADALNQQAVWEGHYGPSYLRDLLPEAAAELRRLHALNLEWEAKAATWLASPELEVGILDARAAIAKAEGKK